MECERGFSRLTQTKTNIRNKVKGEHLESCMRISISDITQEELQQNAAILIRNWRTSWQRRTGDKADVLMVDNFLGNSSFDRMDSPEY